MPALATEGCPDPDTSPIQLAASPSKSSKVMPQPAKGWRGFGARILSKPNQALKQILARFERTRVALLVLLAVHLAGIITYRGLLAAGVDLSDEEQLASIQTEQGNSAAEPSFSTQTQSSLFLFSMEVAVNLTALIVCHALQGDRVMFRFKTSLFLIVLVLAAATFHINELFLARDLGSLGAGIVWTLLAIAAICLLIAVVLVTAVFSGAVAQSTANDEQLKPIWRTMSQQPCVEPPLSHTVPVKAQELAGMLRQDSSNRAARVLASAGAIWGDEAISAQQIADRAALLWGSSPSASPRTMQRAGSPLSSAEETPRAPSGAAVEARASSGGMSPGIEMSVKRDASLASPDSVDLGGCVLIDGCEISTRHATAVLAGIERFRAASRLREAFRGRITRGRDAVVAVALLIAAMLTGAVFNEYRVLFTNVDPMYSDADLRALNDRAWVDSYYGAGQAEMGHNQTVMMVILDGTRADRITKNQAFHDFVFHPDVLVDSWHSRVSAALPSMSVPNWLTLLLGATPERHGTMGNLLVPETSFDSLFREVKLHPPPQADPQELYYWAGLTASPWMGEIVRSQLPFMRGDGTIATSYNANGRANSADAADNARGRVAVDMVQMRDKPYTWTLTHFSDVDIQGHTYGVSTEFNTDDTYQSALANKTALLWNIVKAMNATAASTGRRFTLVITADHGHVDRGGHGSVGANLINVPLIVWSPGSGLGERVRAWHGASYAEPADGAAPGVAQPASADAAAGTTWYPAFKRDDGTELLNVDVTASIAALLGVPAPRQSQGVPIDEIMLLLADASTGASPSAGAAGITPGSRPVHGPAAAAPIARLARVLYDTFAQQQSLAQVVGRANGSPADLDDWIMNSPLPAVVASRCQPLMQTSTNHSVADLKACRSVAVQAVSELQQLMADARARGLSLAIARNMICAVVLVFLMALFMHLFSQRYTLLDAGGVLRFLVFRCDACKRGLAAGSASWLHRLHGGYEPETIVAPGASPAAAAASAAAGAGPASSSETAGAMKLPEYISAAIRWGLHINLRALGIALGLQTLYWAGCFVAFFGLYALVGYDGLFNSTLVHSPDPLLRFLLIVIAPALALLALVYRIMAVTGYEYALASGPARVAKRLSAFSDEGSDELRPKVSPVRACASFCMSVCCVRQCCVPSGLKPVQRNVNLLYLVRTYYLWCSVCSVLIIAVLMASFSFPLPGFFRIRYITPTLWVLRFQVLTAAMMAVPNMFMAVVIFARMSHTMEQLAEAGYTKQLRVLQDQVRNMRNGGSSSSVVERLSEATFKIVESHPQLTRAEREVIPPLILMAQLRDSDELEDWLAREPSSDALLNSLCIPEASEQVQKLVRREWRRFEPAP